MPQDDNRNHPGGQAESTAMSASRSVTDRLRQGLRERLGSRGAGTAQTDTQGGAAAAAAAASPLQEKPVEDPRWAAMIDRALEELKECDPVYRPTDFWGPGLTQLLDNLRERGLADFKRWPSATWWFYPLYGNSFGNVTMDKVFEYAKTINPGVRRPWLFNALSGGAEAARDFDVIRLAWDQERWPMDLEGFGESAVGNPWQHYPLVPGSDVRHARPYLNYLLCLTALSRHVDEPPSSFLEIGGGYGSLGEIVLARDPEARYVNLDIPPLVVVASYYLTQLFGEDRILDYGDLVAPNGAIDIPQSGCIPNWRLPDVKGPFDVFVNSYSFQEMEPDVVEHYVEKVSEIGPKYVVSLNSMKGKPKKADGHAIGVVDPVTSSRIIEMFERRGYELCGAYNRPLIISAGEIAVLRRR